MSVQKWPRIRKLRWQPQNPLGIEQVHSNDSKCWVTFSKTWYRVVSCTSYFRFIYGIFLFSIVLIRSVWSSSNTWKLRTCSITVASLIACSRNSGCNGWASPVTNHWRYVCFNNLVSSMATSPVRSTSFWQQVLNAIRCWEQILHDSSLIL